MATNQCGTVRLKDPTDFDILELLDDGQRNVAVNIAGELGRNRGYINTRLPDLADYGLLTKIGPADNSGMYAITPKGVAAARLRDEWGEVDDFEERVEERAEQITIHPPVVDDAAEPSEEPDD